MLAISVIKGVLMGSDTWDILSSNLKLYNGEEGPYTY